MADNPYARDARDTDLNVLGPLRLGGEGLQSPREPLQPAVKLSLDSNLLLRLRQPLPSMVA